MSSPAYQVDGHSVDSARFYALACDPKRSVVVEACAGAGKTWMLVSRVLRALLDGAQPQDILAITFTRKAAGEMRSRLAEWLAEFAAPSCSAEHRVQALRARGLDEAQARLLEPSLAGLYERVLQAGRPVEIRTFHAWFSQLLRAAPLDMLAELGLQPDMALIEDLDEHLPEVYRRFHGSVLADLGLRADFETQVLLRGRSQVRKWLDTAWQKRIEIELADVAGTLETSVPDAASHWPEFTGLAHPIERIQAPDVRALMLGVAKHLGADKAAVPSKQGRLLETAVAQADAGTALQGARAALLTLKGELRKKLDAPQLDDAVACLARIQRACDQQEAHAEHLRMLRLGRALIHAFTLYKRASGLADMPDLERCALALLRDGSLSGWLQERLDSRIRHVMVDEFQDTSPLQWQALHAWLSGYAGAGGGGSGQAPPGVFIVGDPKQSIYRFRRAEPRVFEAARDFVLNGLQGHVLACDHTRRNAPAVLAAVNPVFEQAQAAVEFHGFRAHTTDVASEPGAGVAILPRTLRPLKPAQDADEHDALVWRDSLTTPRYEAEEALRQQEARQVAHAVRELVRERQVPPGDIFILSRKRSSLRWVAQELAALHLPRAAAEPLPLMHSPVVRDLWAVLDALASHTHHLSLAHALRSPMFGVSDDDLVQVANAVHAAGPATGGWWSALMALADPGAALLRARNLLRRWSDAAEHLPPHDLLDRIVAEGELRERVAAALPPERRAAALAAIDALLGLSLTLDGARYATPYNFVRALKRGAAKLPLPTLPDAVQLLTVHGAKGLEARVVFVMDADPEPQKPETASVLVDWPVEAAHPLRCAFVYSESPARCPPSLVDVLLRETAARQREELNSLYVAMTRARQQLVFSATEPYAKSGGVSWWQRVEGLAAPWAPAQAGVDAHGSSASAEAVVTLLALPALTAPGSARPATTPDSMLASVDVALSRLGQAVHRVLEWATAPAWQGLAALLETWCAAAASEFATDPAEVQRIARRILESPSCARFFGEPAAAWAGNEVAVSDGDDLLRLDRLVAIDADGQRVWWVLDYKLHPAPQFDPDNRAQLLRYREVVRGLQPSDSVRCAFISGNGEVIELV
jgi:ATP-dependent helicase/nuclease subunit A